MNLLIPGPGACVDGKPLTSTLDMPRTDELVTSVRDFLRADVMAATEGRPNFLARVASNSLDIVLRELWLANHIARSYRKDCERCPASNDDLEGLRWWLTSELRDGTMTPTDPAWRSTCGDGGQPGGDRPAELFGIEDGVGLSFGSVWWSEASNAAQRCVCAASGTLKPSMGARAAAIPGRGRPSATHTHLRLGHVSIRHLESVNARFARVRLAEEDTDGARHPLCTSNKSLPVPGTRCALRISHCWCQAPALHIEEVTAGAWHRW